jgi:hypothetical protein
VTAILFGKLILHPCHILYSDHSDLLTETLPAKHFLVRSWQQTGELPLWCPYSYGGMPFLHDTKVGAYYPLHLPLYLLPEAWLGSALSWLVVVHVFAAGVCMFLYARSQGYDDTGALVAAVGYMLAGKWLLHVLAGGHYFMTPLAWLPLVLWGLDQAIRKGSFAAATGAALAYSLMILAGHPQMVFYTGIFAGVWSLGPVLADRDPQLSLTRNLARWLGFGAYTALLAGALAGVELLPALEAATQATRGSGVPSGASPWFSIMILSELLGAPVAGPSWEAPTALAILWVVAALLAIPLGTRLVRFQALVAGFLLIFALGGGAALQFLPGFGLFQIHSRMLLLLSVPVSLLAGVTVRRWLHNELPARRARQTLVLVVAASLFLALGRWRLADAKDLVPPIYWATLLLLLPITYFLLGRHATPLMRWLGAAILLADATSLSWQLVQVHDQDSIHEPSACVRYLSDHRQDHGRVLDRGLREPSRSPLDPALPLLYEIESLRGYNSVDVRRYKEYLQFITDDSRPLLPRQGAFGFPIMGNFPIANKNLLDLLGVRYVLQPSQTPSKWLQGSGEIGTHSSWTQVENDPDPHAYLVVLGGIQKLPPFTTYENRDVFARAFVVPEAVRLPAHSVLPALKSTQFDRQVLLEGLEEEPMMEKGSLCVSDIVTYQPNCVVIQTTGETAGYLVLTDVWFPGWKCTLDGEPVPIYRANYLFRAIRVTGGKHEVVFRFEPWSYHWGRIASLAALTVAVLMGASPWLPCRWKVS